ncbi:MAG: TRAP transporter small permease subunit [Spirochaetota bacterium]
MIKAVKTYVRTMDSISTVLGKFVMFWVVGMIGILIYETISRTIFNKPHIWAVEMAQFVMAAYYTMGGCYSHLIEGHVRMDLFYQRWSAKRRAIWDLITAPFLLFYLAVLLIGALQGIKYSLKYNQVTYSAWAPPVAPIKIIMAVGIALMTLQTISQFFKDIGMANGEEIK